MILIGVETQVFTFIGLLFSPH